MSEMFILTSRYTGNDLKTSVDLKAIHRWIKIF